MFHYGLVFCMLSMPDSIDVLWKTNVLYFMLKVFYWNKCTEHVYLKTMCYTYVDFAKRFDEKSTHDGMYGCYCTHVCV